MKTFAPEYIKVILRKNTVYYYRTFTRLKPYNTHVYVTATRLSRMHSLRKNTHTAGLHVR